MFFITAPPTTELYTLSLHDALPISRHCAARRAGALGDCRQSKLSADPSRAGGRRPHDHLGDAGGVQAGDRSEEHTSELQSRPHLVCRLLLEKKKNSCYLNRPLQDLT